jgi:hypothetical protein
MCILSFLLRRRTRIDDSEILQVSKNDALRHTRRSKIFYKKRLFYKKNCKVAVVKRSRFKNKSIGIDKDVSNKTA